MLPIPVPPTTNDGRELPRYRFSLGGFPDGVEVPTLPTWAVQIKKVQLGAPPRLHLEAPDFGPFEIDSAFIVKNHPRAGGWCVITLAGNMRYESPESFATHYRPEVTPDEDSEG